MDRMGKEEKTLAGGARLRGGQPSGILARPIRACMTFLRLQRFLIGPGLFVELACCSQLMKRGSRDDRTSSAANSAVLLQPPGPIPTFADAGRQGLCSRVAPNWLRNQINCQYRMEGRRVYLSVHPTARAAAAYYSSHCAGCSNAAGHDIRRMWDGCMALSAMQPTRR